MPADDTIPQSSEGDQYLSESITPRAAANQIAVRYLLQGTMVSAGGFTVGHALFKDSETNARAANWWYMNSTARQGMPAHLSYKTIANGTTAQTWKVRVGSNSADTFNLNGAAGGRYYGGVAVSFIEIEEIQA